MILLLALSLIVNIAIAGEYRKNSKLLSIYNLSGGAMDGFDMQKTTDFVVGKDRELIHASIDLKWLFDTISNQGTWVKLFDSLAENVRRLHRGYDAEVHYREQAGNIGREIYEIDPDNFHLRIFQQSIHSAQSLAASIDRPILLYCEEEPDEVIPSLPTFLLRRALASKKVGSMINQQFIFMASYQHHKYAKYFLDYINSDPTRPPVSAPIIIALFPRASASIGGKKVDVANGDNISKPPFRPLQLPQLRLPIFQSFRNSLHIDVGPVFSIPHNSRDDRALREYLQTVIDQYQQQQHSTTSPSIDSETPQSIVKQEVSQLHSTDTNSITNITDEEDAWATSIVVKEPNELISFQEYNPDQRY